MKKLFKIKLNEVCLRYLQVYIVWLFIWVLTISAVPAPTLTPQQIAIANSGRPTYTESAMAKDEDFENPHTVTVRFIDYNGEDLCDPFVMTVDPYNVFSIKAVNIMGRTPYTDEIMAMMGGRDVIYSIYYGDFGEDVNQAVN